MKCVENFSLSYKFPSYCIRSIRRRCYYLFHHAILCGFYSRAAFIIYPKKTATLDTAEQEESGPFVDINDGKEETEENEIVLRLEDY